MENIYSINFFYDLLYIMFIVGLVVFISLYFVDAGYGKMRTEKWGPAMSNKAGWFLMEAPVFLVVLYLYFKSLPLYDGVTANVPYWVFFLLFEFHYFQRSFIFPFLLKGKGKMPFAIMILSFIWNVINGYIQGFWLFHLAPQFYPDLYTPAWVTTPQFIIGTVIFIIGWCINMHSDYVIRTLRKPGDTNHYLPKKGLYKYVTSANYLGEITEWLGFAILTWSLAGLLFFWFSCCNLVPRSNAIYKKYEEEFPDEFDRKKLKRIIPFIY
jgi:3-oxo-5-alpha-steroid 4-dehydrogenase 1